MAIFAKSTDFFLDIAKGNVPGSSIQFILGNNPGVTLANIDEVAWDQGGTYTYLSAAATLNVSSSSALDIGQTIVVVGLDGDYNEVIRIGVLNGQNQVALDGPLLRVHLAQNFSGTDLVGDVYIAETDTLTLGVPDDVTKIKGKIRLGKGITRQFTYTVPAGKSLYITEQVLILGKNFDVDAAFRLRALGGVFVTTINALMYQTITNVHLSAPFTVAEKSDFEARYQSPSAGTPFTVNYAGVLATN